VTKAQDLEKVKAEAARTLSRPGLNLVFGEGNPEAKIMFIGEAPGFNEDRLGRPFVGQAGKLLDRLLEGIGIRREDVYITNILKTRPPNNRDPLPDEMKAGEPTLDQQIDIISPEVIVTLGRFSMGKFIPGVKITAVHGEPRRVGRRVVVPMFHPAAALRSPSVMKLLEEDFLKLPQIVASADKIYEEGQDPNQLTLI
jgi:uracil-DNA glycosylase